MNVYERNITTREHFVLFCDFTILLEKVIKTLIIECGLTIVAFLAAPGILYILGGSQLEPILPFVIPGTTLNTTSGYILNYIHQFYAISICGLGVYTLFALYFSFLILHVILLVNTMRSNLGFINKTALDKGPVLEIRINLRNLVLIHNETRA